MIEEQGNTFDIESEKKEVKTKSKKQKSKTKKVEKELSVKSFNDSNKFNGQGTRKEEVIDEDMEEEALLRKELGDDSEPMVSQRLNLDSQGDNSKIESNGNTTVDSHIQEKSMGLRNSTRSNKQSNL